MALPYVLQEVEDLKDKTIQVNLASTTAATIGDDDALTPGVTGILPIARGGTGNSTGLAAKATADASGNTITSTYITGLSASGTTVTYTYGDGSTGTITTQDNNTDTKVTQTVTTTSAEYPILTCATANNTTSATTTTRFGKGVTLNPSTSTITATAFDGTASKATADASGNTITSTYIKGVSVSDGVITLTNGAGTTSTVTITCDDLVDIFEDNL